jgi:thiosulfate/3-mercaptopyruvate sulfurtransferase
VIPAVVGIDFLDEHPDAVVVDVRWYLDGRDGRSAFEAGHLPGAQWVDLDRALAATGLPSTEGRHPLPEPSDFAAAMEGLGIGDDTVVVAYDDSGGLTAGRLVVMLRMLGHDAAVLDGGIAAWTGPLETGPAADPPSAGTRFGPRPWPAERLVTAEEVAALAAGGGVVLDARIHERFTGEQALIDPRPGHVPGARSAPWGSVLGPDGKVAPVDRLRAHFACLGVTPEALERGEVATYCGSGVSACINIVAMEHAGLPPARLYAASWSGWSSDPQRPAELGE